MTEEKREPLPRRLLSSEYVAARLQIKLQSLRIRRMRGLGPPYIRLDDRRTSRVFYPEKEFLEWLASRPIYWSTGEEKAALGPVFKKGRKKRRL